MSSAGDNKAEQLEYLMRVVEERTLRIMTSEGFKHYLATFARFHNYSLHNILLIEAQRPSAQCVAGFKTWQSSGRWIKQGQKGIAIFIPRFQRREDDSLIQESDTEVLKEPGKHLVGFIVGHVFDVSQTQGKALPQAPPVDLGQGGGVAEHLMDDLGAWALVQGLKLERQALGEKLYGFYSRKDKKIVLDASLSPAHAFCVLTHECAHAFLHNAAQLKARPDVGRAQRELEAEAVAFIVCARAGVATDMDSAAYIALHQKHSHPKDVVASFRASTQYIMRAANQMIHALHLDLDLSAKLTQSQSHSQSAALVQ